MSSNVSADSTAIAPNTSGLRGHEFHDPIRPRRIRTRLDSPPWDRPVVRVDVADHVLRDVRTEVAAHGRVDPLSTTPPAVAIGDDDDHRRDTHPAEDGVEDVLDGWMPTHPIRLRTHLQLRTAPERMQQVGGRVPSIRLLVARRHVDEQIALRRISEEIVRELRALDSRMDDHSAPAVGASVPTERTYIPQRGVSEIADPDGV